MTPKEKSDKVKVVDRLVGAAKAMKESVIADDEDRYAYEVCVLLNILRELGFDWAKCRISPSMSNSQLLKAFIMDPDNVEIATVIDERFPR